MLRLRVKADDEADGKEGATGHDGRSADREKHPQTLVHVASQIDRPPPWAQQGPGWGASRQGDCRSESKNAGQAVLFLRLLRRAAFLSATAGAYEIELVDGEDGVSPGQACVFYDSAEGQARVLGGGFIRAAAAAARAA